VSSFINRVMILCNTVCSASSVGAGTSTKTGSPSVSATPENDFASVVLHEFGHAIGLLHEHNHPELELRWKKDVVYADLGGPPNHWSREDIDFNVFLQYPLNRIVASDKPDLVSIMIYTIPSRWLSGQKAITPSDHLSKGASHSSGSCIPERQDSVALPSSYSNRPEPSANKCRDRQRGRLPTEQPPVARPAGCGARQPAHAQMARIERQERHERGEPALRLQHRRARLRARGRISPLVAFAAAEASGTDRSRRPEHAPNRSSALVRGIRLPPMGVGFGTESALDFLSLEVNMTTFTGSATSPVFEVGLVRFKITVSAGVIADSNSAPTPPGSRLSHQESLSATRAHVRPSGPRAPASTTADSVQIPVGVAVVVSKRVSVGFSAAVDPAGLANLVTQPSPRGFARGLLQAAAPSLNLTIGEWGALAVGLDSDVCIFSIGANLPPDLLRQQVGSQMVGLASSVTFAFGPSKAAWRAMAMRLGATFPNLVARVAPPLATGGAAATTTGFFATWLGPLAWAIPIGIGVRDFSVAICRAAWARGVQRGHWNQFAMAYVRAAYGVPLPHHSSSPSATRGGAGKAEQDIARHGVSSVRRYLEQNFREGRPIPSRGRTYDDREVAQVGFELGEAMFAAQPGEGARVRAEQF